MNANDMNEQELLALASVYYLDGKFELVKQIADHFVSLGFERAEIMKDIRMEKMI